jgi:hypothetical protein
VTLTAPPRAPSEGDYIEARRLNVPLFLVVLVPQLLAALALAGVVPLSGGLAVAVSVLGVVGIGVYRQYAARLAGHPGYERVEALHRLMAVAIVTGVALLLTHVVLFAMDVATGACACA